MCGIFGMIGRDNVIPTTLQAMKMLEYRGYDSVGLATIEQREIAVYKQTGRIEQLTSKLQDISSNIAIGHTRWATHGNVTNDNAHPFVSNDNEIALVHNGIIENHSSIRTQLLAQGVVFGGQTDSEVIVHLLSQLYSHSGDMLHSVKQCVDSLVGSYALAIMHRPSNKLYLVRQHSPLCVSIDGFNRYVCSDTNTISSFASNIVTLPDKSISVLDKELSVYDYQLQPLTVTSSYIESSYTRHISQDYMLEEIISIPRCIEKALDRYNGLCCNNSVVKRAKRIYFVGCGTAYHAGVVVARQMSQWCDIDIHCVVASEFAYGSYLVDNNTIVILISQSGETADTLLACTRANDMGAYTYAVVNVANSSLCSRADAVSYIHAGAEIAVASTKAYTNSVLVLLLLVMDMARVRGCITQGMYQCYIEQLHALPSACDTLMSAHNIPQLLQGDIPSAVFFIGRDIDYATAMESSLKLKEISYIHSEAYPAGELKHGTLALVEQGVLVVAICTNNALLNKCANAVSEVASRGAKVLTVSQYDIAGYNGITLPIIGDIGYSILSVLPMQLLAYYYAKKLGRDVDKPKNLAKSVTVE